uniref:Uncharacterized protein n=1 Tax=Lutzomyia longipalpis TaxID=7200 RepID=A0A1B0GLC1_LUTLO
MHNSCSNVSHKFLRRSPGRRAGNHQRAISSGSYDLTGPGVEPRLEIGHPILINKTAIDVDSIDLRTATTTEVDSVIHETETESSDSEVSHVPHSPGYYVLILATT